MPIHYVCPVCGEVSKEPDTCRSNDCSNWRGALKPCRCRNNEHAEVIANRTQAKRKTRKED
ncbi:MAG: hypothetical protein HY519_02540 [Candidatus Aenigmarchaeota archaeon]|nr:hypothetical protein [Candidatus Aenigmarchaeota archaeon]